MKRRTGTLLALLGLALAGCRSTQEPTEAAGAPVPSALPEIRYYEIADT